MLPCPSSTVTVVIDGYTHNSILTSGDSVPLGTQIILVCRVVGLPYGTPLSYTWTCLGFPHEQCEPVNGYSRKFYNDHILAVNTTFTLAGGTYTCQVTATGGQEATGSFTLRVTGMCVCLALYAAVMVQALHLSCTHIQVVVLCTALTVLAGSYPISSSS